MTRKPARLIANPPLRLRQRLRADGSWRIWWEPRPDQVKLGFVVVELDADRLRWSLDQAARLNDQVTKATAAGIRPADPRASGRCMSDLIASYVQTVHYTVTLKPAARKSYRAQMLQIEAKWGPVRVAAFDKATMNAWYQSMFHEKGPRTAQYIIRVMSILFGHAETLGWRPDNSNPCLRLKVHTPKPRDRVASWAEIDALLAAADACGLASMGLAIRLSLYQGQRQTDVITAARGAFELRPVIDRARRATVMRWVWSFRRSKRGNDAMMDLHGDVVPHLRKALATAAPDDARLLHDDRIGRPYDEDLFAKRWAEVRALAAKTLPGISTLQFRDLRRTFGVLARAGGASRDDTGDVLGNSAAVNPTLGETYMPASYHTASRAVAAIQRPDSAQTKRNKG